MMLHESAVKASTQQSHLPSSCKQDHLLNIGFISISTAITLENVDNFNRASMSYAREATVAGQQSDSPLHLISSSLSGNSRQGSWRAGREPFELYQGSKRDEAAAAFMRKSVAA